VASDADAAGLEGVARSGEESAGPVIAEGVEHDGADQESGTTEQESLAHGRS
jgi:hypothetical protein